MLMIIQRFGRLALAGACATMALACESTGSNDAAGDATVTGDVATDGSDSVDSTDATDSVDATDGVDATDSVDATDGTDGVDATDGTDGVDATDGDPGEAVYNQLCVGCHGAGADAGKGSGIGPSVRFVNRGFGQHVIRSGRDEMSDFSIAMPKFDAASLPDDKLGALLDYLHSFEKPTTGEGLFLTFCANCHGRNALGGRVGEGIKGKPAGEYFELVREGHAGTNYGASTSYMPSWATAELSDSDVTAIVDYVKTL